MNEDLGNCRDSREDFDTEEIECDIQTLDLCIYNFPKGGVDARNRWVDCLDSTLAYASTNKIWRSTISAVQNIVADL